MDVKNWDGPNGEELNHHQLSKMVGDRRKGLQTCQVDFPTIQWLENPACLLPA